MKKNDFTIEEILNFDFSKELDFDLISNEEKDKFNKNLFENLINRIILKTTRNFLENEQKEFEELVSDDVELEKIFEFIAKKNKKFIEETGEEYLDFKKEIYQLLN